MLKWFKKCTVKGVLTQQLNTMKLESHQRSEVEDFAWKLSDITFVGDFIPKRNKYLITMYILLATIEEKDLPSIVNLKILTCLPPLHTLAIEKGLSKDDQYFHELLIDSYLSKGKIAELLNQVS